MSIKYDSKREPLSEIIKKATINATYVIPDLQRPYVWSPRQVTMLIDSLFRGWPFGSLLLWEVKPDCFAQNEGIPHRPFWQVVDRTNNDRESTASALGQPATYQMVLDGQQRVQSLILALGGDQWGFQLYDADWALDLQDRRVRPSSHWSKASLCVDVEKFEAELLAKNDVVRRIEAGKILEWAILDGVAGQSTDNRPVNYIFPLLTTKERPGRFIRLSRFWDMVQKDLAEREYKKLLEPMLIEHGVPEKKRQELLDPLAEFMKVVENIKTNSYVHALQIESFELTPQWGKDDYSDAIVNIFTRLNTAGRTLTREEITLAWLNVGWEPTKTDGKAAGECLAELQVTLSDSGFTLETDEIVRLISFIWSVENRGGRLLDSKDLLKGEIVRSMARAVASTWNSLKPRLKSGSELIKERDLIENQGSFNAIIVFLAWFRITFDRYDALALKLPVVGGDSFEKQLREIANEFLDRWVFGSQWANAWGEAATTNFDNFAADLSLVHSKLAHCLPDELISTVKDGVSQLMSRVANKATEQINVISVRDRRRVSAYYPFLWVWHRLDKDRWQYSSIPMRTGRKKKGKLEVDHTIADAWWGRLVAKQIAEKLTDFKGTDEEKAMVAPDDFESPFDATSFINLLGNCSLLDKSFNISKSDAPMWEFLEDVHEFKEGKIGRAAWEAALSLSEDLTEPDGYSLGELRKTLLVRDATIRRDLAEFIAGSRFRTDVLP